MKNLHWALEGRKAKGFRWSWRRRNFSEKTSIIKALEKWLRMQSLHWTLDANEGVHSSIYSKYGFFWNFNRAGWNVRWTVYQETTSQLFNEFHQWNNLHQENFEDKLWVTVCEKQVIIRIVCGYRALETRCGTYNEFSDKPALLINGCNQLERIVLNLVDEVGSGERFPQRGNSDKVRLKINKEKEEKWIKCQKKNWQNRALPGNKIFFENEMEIDAQVEKWNQKSRDWLDKKTAKLEAEHKEDINGIMEMLSEIKKWKKQEGKADLGWSKKKTPPLK